MVSGKETDMQRGDVVERNALGEETDAGKMELVSGACRGAPLVNHFCIVLSHVNILVVIVLLPSSW